jgi:hypothetical protein
MQESTAAELLAEREAASKQAHKGQADMCSFNAAVTAATLSGSCACIWRLSIAVYNGLIKRVFILRPLPSNS